jgi:hypothetical protein
MCSIAQYFVFVKRNTLFFNVFCCFFIEKTVKNGLFLLADDFLYVVRGGLVYVVVEPV